MTDAQKWLNEQRARSDAAMMIRRVAAYGPRLKGFRDETFPGAPPPPAQINCRCVMPTKKPS